LTTIRLTQLTVCQSVTNKRTGGYAHFTSREVCAWDAVTGKRTATWEKSYSRPRQPWLGPIVNLFPEEYAFHPWSVSFTPDGRLIAFGCDSRDPTTVEMWQVADVP